MITVIKYENDLMFSKWVSYIESLDVTVVFEDCYKNDDTLENPLISTECKGIVSGNKGISEIESVSTKIKRPHKKGRSQEYDKTNDMILLFESCGNALEIVGFAYGKEKLTKEEFKQAYRNMKACFEW